MKDKIAKLLLSIGTILIIINIYVLIDLFTVDRYDINQDGKVDSIDVLVLKKYILEKDNE